MIIAKCPLRISLVGGSTDLDSFINRFGRGSIVGFPCNLYTSIILQRDKLGLNSEGKYVVSYSKKEVVSSIADIHNDVAREALQYFKIPPIGITFYSDIHSQGSGLASSSSYMNGIIKAIHHIIPKYEHTDIQYVAHYLEKRFNPLLGQQDSYGCGIGGLKKIDFYPFPVCRPEIYELDSTIFEHLNMFLIPTNIYRKSTPILETVCLKNNSLLKLVEDMVDVINNKDHNSFHKIINEGWQKKKESSNKITENIKIQELDDKLNKDPDILSYKLCGAGNGGFFLVFTNKPQLPFYRCIRIEIDNNGVTSVEV